MLLSQFFLPTIKEDPKEASVASHKFLLRSGMIRQVTAGIYNWLPLGLSVLKKVENIVREEMNNAGAVEILMPCIQPIDLWRKSGRFGAEGDLSAEMLKIKDRHENDLTFAPTAEEVIADLFKNSVQSYKELPKNLYQISWKFRDEIRPRFGLMRGREFLMKDAYSFDIDEASAIATYEKMLVAYAKAYRRMGLVAIPVAADTGSIGGKYSHEFHVMADTGESTIFFEKGLIDYLNSDEISLEGFQKFYANEKDKHDPKNLNVPESDIDSRKGIEVGHIFYLGDKYSKSMEVQIQDRDGRLFYPQMGCYGIGVSRLVAALIEANHDEQGIIWPESVAPFKVGILNLRVGDEACDSAANEVYDLLRAHNIDVLMDDTDASIGQKFSRMDLIGLPWCLSIGPKGLKEGKVELKYRRTGEKHELSLEAAKNMLTKAFS